jgi:hypothetical protein
VTPNVNSLDSNKQFQDRTTDWTQPLNWSSDWDSPIHHVPVSPTSYPFSDQPPLSSQHRPALESISATDLFDLRQAILRYANPLRAKILLFALLHQTNHCDQDQQALLVRSYELDQLLRRTLRRYQQFSILAGQMQKTARRLADPDEYGQTAIAILRAIKPFYTAPHNRPHGNNQSRIPSSISDRAN